MDPIAREPNACDILSGHLPVAWSSLFIVHARPDILQPFILLPFIQRAAEKAVSVPITRHRCTPQFHSGANIVIKSQ